MAWYSEGTVKQRGVLFSIGTVKWCDVRFRLSYVMYS